MRPIAPRRDPAPSRWAYRWHRLWLTPLFRALVRVGLPAFVVVFSAGLWISDEGRRALITDQFTATRDAVQNRPEFMVNLVAIEGASPVLADALRRDLGLELPKSSFDLDLAVARDQVEAFDAVERADLRILSGGILQIAVTERLPALVWRSEDALQLVDANGHPVASISARALRGDLPLIAGASANTAAAEALELVAAAGPLTARIRGLVRMGNRRWDIVLDRDQRLLLPADNPVRALQRIIALDQAEGLLKRDLLAVDLRNDRRPTLRLSPEAAQSLRQTKITETRGGTL
ncbi:MAG: cell division protein FtsQ/DivIB [Gemmobacter sp.]|nr:cell division protein FtsQ/DivIB [Gemmobacter sp.]